MKTNVFYIFILFALIAILFSTGCKKNGKNENVGMQTQPEPQNQIDIKQAKMFTIFKNQSKIQTKDDREISVDSATWYLQGTANFEYGKASQERSTVIIDSTFITLALSNGNISLSECSTKYSEMIDSIRSCYQKIDRDEKQLISASVQIKSLTKTNLIIKVTPIFSYGGTLVNFCTFNDVDSWTWWNFTGNGGICAGPNYPGGNGLDAAILIDRKIMNCMGVPIGNYYYTDQETVWVEPYSYPNPNWIPGNVNYEEGWLYTNYEGAANFHGCLSASECNFYLTGTKWVANHDQPGGARPVGKTLISVAIFGDETAESKWPYYSTYLHHGPIYYGILHWNPNPPIPF